MPTITANIPQPKDVSPELNTNNKLTEQTNQILGASSNDDGTIETGELDYSGLISELSTSTKDFFSTIYNKLNQILTAQQTMSINENLVLKVGDSIFKGKITGVNKSK